ncbi:hypothetical protein [Pseudarthrobacter sp. B4EP4b]|uniref:hypothetical protein n=1 Tax=Pseudarthrobacter sp. B4EP4b TaxID=2590664 RepID=UPI00114FFBCB|nr:hypothetical protein [Pseudarthrobacter sp. B4EP4b]
MSASGGVPARRGGMDMVSGACAGTYGAKLTIVKGDGEPEASSFECGSTLDRFVRHDGGPITHSAVPPSGKPAATGVKVQTNPDRRASELEDLSEWSEEQLQPRLPGELRGTSSGNTTSTATLMAAPGQYELQFVCDWLPGAQLSVSTAAGVEVLAPVQVPCTGTMFKAPVLLPTEGAGLTMIRTVGWRAASPTGLFQAASPEEYYLSLFRRGSPWIRLYPFLSMLTIGISRMPGTDGHY